MFRYYRKKSIALLLTVCFLLTMVVPGFAQGTGDTGNSLQNARDGIVGYYLKNKTNLGSWREVVALKGAGQDVSKAPWTLPDWKIDQLNKDSQPTDYAGTILGMLAVGQDPKNVAVSDQVYRNLVAELADMQKEDGSFGTWFNHTIWAVIALDKSEENYDTAQALEYLLSQQKSDGGFALFGDTADPDITGMVLMALAPHKDVPAVSEAINRAIECLKKTQLPNGGFASWGSENAESIATVILGLLACGEDLTSGDWQKEQGNMIDALFSFQLEDGSFSHLKSENKYNALATAQALHAVAELVNAGVVYTVKTGQRHGADETAEATVRVRVEGLTQSLADKTVTITGTVFDALKAAVGETNLVANGDQVVSICNEGPTRIKNGLYTGWMYYVIRDGAIDTNAFRLSAGSYEVKDGDEIVFYHAAYQTSPPYAVKTYLPDVKVLPTAPTAGQTVTLFISALKLSEDWSGLVPLDNDEIEAIGDYTVKVGDKTYTSMFGQVTITNVTEGILEFVITNSNDEGYPDVVTYKGRLNVGKAVDSTVRVRVEGAEGNLKDATVKVTGTALDALKAVVGAENVDAPSGFVTSILDESGKKISDEISTSWLYYVIRNGSIEPTAFELGAGSFNVQDGDEVVFYIGAYDNKTYASKTYFPVVSVSPQSPKAGQTLTISVTAKKYVWGVGLRDLSPEETAAIGEYTVIIGDQQHLTRNGQVSLPNVSAGTLSFTIINLSAERNYPDVVTFKGSVKVASSSSSGGGIRQGVSVYIAVVGMNKELLFGPSYIEVNERNPWGLTVLGALDATGLSYEISKQYEGFVVSIEGQSNSGTTGWMFNVNDYTPSMGAKDTSIRDSDKIIWWYSKSISDPAPKWSDLVNSSTSTITPNEAAQGVKDVVTDLKNEKVGVSQAIDKIQNYLTNLKEAEITQELKDKLAEATDLIKQSLEKIPEKAFQVQIDKERANINIDGGVIKSQIEAIIKVADLVKKLKDIGLTETEKLIQNNIVIKASVNQTAVNGLEIVFPVDAAKLAMDNSLKLVIKTNDVILSLPPEALQTVLNAATNVSKVEVSYQRIDLSKIKILNEGKVIGDKVLDLEVTALTSEGSKQKPQTNFAQRITITFPLDGIDVSKLDITKLSVYRQKQDGSWEFVGGRLSPDGKTYSFETDHLSLYALMEFKPQFKDIANHWARDTIELMAMRLIARGISEDSFAPDQKLTRAQFAALLVRALGLEEQNPQVGTFNDVSPDYWGYKAIEAASRAGLVVGTGGGRFEPERAIKREEMAAILAAILKQNGIDTGLTDAQTGEILKGYADSDQVSEWAKDKLAACISKGIINGRSATTIAPLGNATRAEAVVVLKNLLQLLGRL
ncbi:MAG TPA: DUF4430 domain-containing protein [Syntrophomonadaceae bacterium]|nr:DUF4430 domain-containing protein [Syntrophomonadaceae bacterium]